MHKKPLFISLFTVIFLTIVFWYSLVLGKANTYNGPIVQEFILSKNIYPESNKLNSTVIILKSWENISDAQFYSDCNTFSKFLEKRNNYYIFTIKYFSDCNNGKIILKDSQNTELYTDELNITSEYELWDKFVDYPTKNIDNVYKSLDKKLLEYAQKSMYKSGFSKAKATRNFDEAKFLYSVIGNILDKRSQKYKIPVEWYDLPTKLSKIPNAWRPYRAAYTDGIHHGWDVGSKLWEEVVSLDDAMVIRVVSGFRFEDLNRITYWENLSEDQKIKNLDILRWNQIWLKTAKWDVVFYSHLQDIFPGIEEWKMVRKGQKVGTIGISWVPDKDYTDYHLHFPIHKNPYNIQMVGKYDYDDYMRWPWYFQSNSLYEVLELQNQVFEK